METAILLRKSADLEVKIKLDDKPTYLTPNCAPSYDFLVYSLVCLLEKLDLTEYGDVNSVYKWIIGEE